MRSYSLHNNLSLETISETNRVDIQLIAVAILLAGIGAVAQFSSSWYFAVHFNYSPFHYFERHLFFLAIGLFLAIVLSLINLKFIKKFTVVVVAGAFLLNLMVFMPGVGETISGGTRWISLMGNKFQPSETAKLAIVIYLAHMFDKNRERVSNVKYSVTPPLVVISLFTGIIVLQNDFSTAFMIFFVSLLMFYAAGVKKRYLGAIGGLASLAAVFAVVMKPYRVRRILAWLDPRQDPQGSGFQLLGSQRALMEGGLMGKGLGAGTVKLRGLPQAHSDFVFAVVGEEAGYIGVVIVVLLFLFLALKGFQIATWQKDCFRKYLAVGISCNLFFQAMVNMAVVSGLSPPTGIPLPFFSQGGSSILMTMIMMGILMNLSRYREVPC